MRRIHIPALINGHIALLPEQAHHLRNVLRLKQGEEIEAFDDSGNTGVGTIVEMSATGVILDITSIRAAVESGILTIASAIPKGARADWMIEKLSELGVGRFIPLATERSVVVPQGQSKLERWRRIATEAAKQSRRSGVMKIEGVMEVGELVGGQADRAAWYLSTEEGADALHRFVGGRRGAVMLLIGPEGGWTEKELALFMSRGISPARLTNTILRVETAAVAGAVVVGVMAFGMTGFLGRRGGSERRGTEEKD